ncbi:FAD binding domain-containing protein [Streptomyces cirratus]|uniref:FAD binding domain-containing protein n=1 Tax=Streptomyces cirratus TaxID=68187 RepID=UPI003606ECA7
MILTEFDYVRPVGLEEALTLLAGTPGARALAGGQSLLPDLRTGAARARLLVDVRHLEELRGVETAPDGTLRIGALTTLAELAAHPLVLERAPEIAAAARANGDPQVRNLGTTGGTWPPPAGPPTCRSRPSPPARRPNWPAATGAPRSLPRNSPPPEFRRRP